MVEKKYNSVCVCVCVPSGALAQVQFCRTALTRVNNTPTHQYTHAREVAFASSAHKRSSITKLTIPLHLVNYAPTNGGRWKARTPETDRRV